jgi:hypothetical protein
MTAEQRNNNKRKATKATNRSVCKFRTPSPNMVSKVTRARHAAAVLKAAWALRRDKRAMDRFPEQAATRRHSIKDIDKVKNLARARHARFGRVVCGRNGGARLKFPSKVAARNQVLWAHRNTGGPGNGGGCNHTAQPPQFAHFSAEEGLAMLDWWRRWWQLGLQAAPATELFMRQTLGAAPGNASVPASTHMDTSL